MYKIYYSENGADILSVKDDNDSVEFISRKILQGWEYINLFQTNNDLQEFLDSDANVDKKICCYGAGKYAQEIEAKLDYSFNDIYCFFDRDKNKKLCGDIDVYTPEKIIDINPDIIIITMLYPWEALKYLDNLKLNKGLHFHIYVLNNLSSKSKEITEKVIKAWTEYNKTDPSTAPSSAILANSNYIEVDKTSKEEYNQLNTLLKIEYSHIFLIRSLERGGAEKVALNYMKALNEINPNKKILAIITTNENNYWYDQLPKNVRLFNFGHNYNLSLDQSIEFLYCIINQCKADKLHILNSDIGYEMLQKYGHKIAKTKKIFDSQFCINISHEGFYIDRPAKYAANHEYLTGLFAENKRYFSDLKKLYDFPKEKFYCHYQPVDFLDEDLSAAGIRIPNKLNVLWASRICQQKRPDLLLKIADVCKYLPMHFHVWGRIPETFDKEQFNKANITYHGEFSSWQFSNQDYDVFLYTAETDGMPNIILEAIANKMPIITSNSGGIKEIMSEDSAIVEQFDDIETYVTKLKNRINVNKDCKKGLNDKDFNTLKYQHSWEAFINSVKEVKEYV